jgi:hypothetical protein
MKYHNPNRPGILQSFGLIAIGIALCVAELYIGILLLVLGLACLWFHFHPPKAQQIQTSFSVQREVETPLTRLREKPTPIPTRYQTGLIDSRCYYCKAGIAHNQPVWMADHESGEERHMCGSCRDSLIVEKRSKG